MLYKDIGTSESSLLHLQVLLIGLMSLPNQLVFILFHPLVCK